MNQLQWLGQQMGNRKKWFYFALFLATLSSLLCIVFPFVTQQITDMILSGQAANGAWNTIVVLAGILVGAQVLRSVVRYAMLMILENVSQNVQEKIRLHLYSNLCAQDDDFYQHHRTGDLITRVIGDLDMVRHMVSWISFSVVESATLFVFAIVYFFFTNAILTISLLVITPLLLGCSYLYSRSVYPLYASLRERMSRMSSVAQENIAGNKMVRAFVREKYECEKFEECNQSYREANLRTNAHWLKFFPIIEGFSQSLTVITVLLGGILIIYDQMTLGDLAAFSLLTWGVSEPMRALGVYLNDFQRFLTSASKVMEIYYAHPQIVSPEDGIRSAAEHGTIRFEHVTCKFNYGKTIALDDVSFSLESGKTLAIMGPTGSGKTTLVNAITRSVDASQGGVFVDGINVKQWDLHQLRKRISVAPQKVQLYSDTIYANVAYSQPDMSMEKVKQYTNLAAADFVADLEDGFDTVIGEQGMGLSGGQKQRIALARALAKEPEILILDDTTSAVDNETEKRLRNNLNNLPYPCTQIVIAQRISAVRDADLILVMDGGKIVQQGTHEQLVKEQGYYREICEMQGVLEEVMA